MLIIPCPHCGPRTEDEFSYGGQAHVPYPEDPFALTDEEWAQYLFYRDNPRGLYRERWCHSGGCRKWFNAERDTRTYDIISTYVGPAPSEPGSRGSAAASASATDTPKEERA